MTNDDFQRLEEFVATVNDCVGDRKTIAEIKEEAERRGLFDGGWKTVEETKADLVAQGFPPTLPDFHYEPTGFDLPPVRLSDRVLNCALIDIDALGYMGDPHHQFTIDLQLDDYAKAAPEDKILHSYFYNETSCFLELLRSAEGKWRVEGQEISLDEVRQIVVEMYPEEHQHDREFDLCRFWETIRETQSVEDAWQLIVSEPLRRVTNARFCATVEENCWRRQWAKETERRVQRILDERRSGEQSASG